jgi:hypothetical protein
MTEETMDERPNTEDLKLAALSADIALCFCISKLNLYAARLRTERSVAAHPAGAALEADVVALRRRSTFRVTGL